jgi:hypothetical protein
LASISDAVAAERATVSILTRRLSPMWRPPPATLTM